MSTMQVKSFRAEFKAQRNGDKGTVTAIVSVFNNVDLGGDRVIPGAFKNTIAEWQTKGDPVPVIWSHEWDEPESHVGFVDPADMKEVDAGLEVKMQFDLDRPRAEQVFHLLKNRRVTQFSFGYFAKNYQDVDDPDHGKVRELTEIELFEVGPTLLGMNPATQLIEAASRFRKATAAEINEGIFAEFNYFGLARGRIEHVMTEGTFGIEGGSYSLEATEEDPALLLRIFRETNEGFVETETLIGRRASQVTVIEPLEVRAKSLETKAIDVPDYVAANAKRGLDYLAEGYGGDGLVDATIRAARQMAEGSVSEEKIRKIGPWIARHIVDLDAPKNSDRNDPDYPGPGLVAMLLWGGGPDKEGARKTQEWAERETAQLDKATKEAPEAIVETTEVPVTEEATGDAQGTINSMDERINELLIETR